jgi:hypothetical protein
VTLAPDWDAAHVHAIAFLQERGTRHIVGAAAARVPD